LFLLGFMLLSDFSSPKALSFLDRSIVMKLFTHIRVNVLHQATVADF